MDVREAISIGMKELLADENSILLGYNILYGSKGYGTLKYVDQNKLIEMPLSEALMAGSAIGLAISGKKPIIFYERQDFLTLSMDAFINHLGLLPRLSNNEFSPNIIIRAVVGGTTPFNPGLQHTKNLVKLISDNIPCILFEPKTVQETIESYKLALSLRETTTVIISEERDLYDSNR